MGKGGPLSAWIREFTTLVFVQTVQAFIFAIIILLIMSAMEPPTDTSEADDYNVGVGLMCVFALTSLFKVEEIVKKIFGLQATKADHSNAIKSIAKTAFAVKLGKRALDNGKKITGGVKQISDARKNSLKNKQRYKEDLNDLGIKDPNATKVEAQKDNTLLGGGTNTVATSPRYRDFDSSQSSLMPGAVETSSNGNNKIPVKDVANGADISTPSRNQVGAAGEFNYVDNALNSNEINAKTQQKLRSLKRQYEDKEKEFQKQKKQGIESIAKGITETGGVIIGATAGAILGGADGNLDEAFQGAVAGAGVGDAIGEGAVNIGKTAIKTGEHIVNLPGNVVKLAKTGKDKIVGAPEDFNSFKKEIQQAKTNIQKELEKEGKDAGKIEVELDAISTTIKTRRNNNKSLAKQSISSIEKDFLKSKNVNYGKTVDDL